MKVTFINENKKVEFQELNCGDTFIDPNYKEDIIFVVVEETLDVLIKPDIEGAEFFGYAAAINDSGMVFGYEAKEKVIPINLEVIVSMK